MYEQASIFDDDPLDYEDFAKKIQEELKRITVIRNGDMVTIKREIC